MRINPMRLVLAPITCLATLLLLDPAHAQGFPTPGPEHQALKELEGEWTATIKSPEGESKGTMVWKMTCGGMWLSSDFRSEFGGMEFQGRGLDGYDPIKKKYVSVWVDSMGSSPLIFEGTMDESKKSLTLTAEGPGPDGSPVKYKSVSKQTDANHITFAMSIVAADGTENEMMTIDYVRK